MNEKRWTVIPLIAFVGVACMGLVGNYGFKQGEEAGRLEGRHDINQFMLNENKACWDAAKTDEENRDCLVQFDITFRALTKFSNY